MGRPRLNDGMRRDHRGNRLKQCGLCGKWKRAAERFPGGGAACGACLARGKPRSGRPAQGGAWPRSGSREDTSPRVAEIDRRIEAARRLKAIVRGDTLTDWEIDAVCEPAGASPR